MGNVFGLVGSHAKDHIVNCLIVINAIATNDAIMNDNRGLDGNMQGSYSSLAFASVILRKRLEGRGDKEWGSIVVGLHGPVPCMSIGVNGRIEGDGGHC